MSVQIREVNTFLIKRDFLKLPWRLHSHDKNWVPPLLSVVKGNLDTKKNPFYKHAVLKCWVAYQNNKPVGRIAGIINHRHNEYHQEKIVFWGFFETTNDFSVTTALFHTIETWGRSTGMTCLRGPVNPSTNHECGLQISAFESKPYIMTTQNPAYYPNLVEESGHIKAKDLQAWTLKRHEINFNKKLLARAESVSKSPDIIIRPIDLKNYDQEIDRLFEVYNDAWEHNWGFVPLTRDEFYHTAKELKFIMDPKAILIVEVKGEIAAAGICLPDINQALIYLKNGRLFPTGLLKLIWHIKIKKNINRTRIPILGTRHKFRHMHLGALLYATYGKISPTLTGHTTECSWILEDNRSMQTGLRLMNAVHYKTYRIYEKALS